MHLGHIAISPHRKAPIPLEGWKPELVDSFDPHGKLFVYFHKILKNTATKIGLRTQLTN